MADLKTMFGTFYTDINNTGTNRLVESYYDIDTNDFVVYSWTSDALRQAGETPQVHTSGRKCLSSDTPYMFFLVEQLQANYFRCVGSDLEQFFGQPEFPYANKVTTVNSPTCNVIICDLTVIQPIETTPSNTQLSADGTATVTATSTNGAVTFSLTEDGTFVAADSVDGDSYTKNYTGLTAGIYTVYTKDPQGCTANANFEITSLGDFETKYYTETVKNNKVRRVNIKEKGYSGDPIYVKWGSVTRMIGEQNADLFKVVRGGVLKMSLIATPEYDLTDLETNDERQYLVEYLIDGELDFKGYILPDLTQRPLGPPPYYAEIEATDQLGTLKNKDFATLTGESITGKKSMLEIIKACLDFTELELDIVSGANIYEVNQSQTDSDEPLLQQYLKADQFEGVKCEDVLERVLLNYKLYQWGGQWLITPIVQVDPYAIRLFENLTLSTTETIDPTLALTNLGAQTAKVSLLGNKEAFLTFREPYSEVIVTHNLGPDSQLIEDGFFDNWDDNVPIDWFGTAVQQGLVEKETKADNPFDFIMAINDPGVSETVGEYIESREFKLNYEGGGQREQFNFAIKVKLDADMPNQTSEVGVPIRIEIVADGVTYYTGEQGVLTSDPNSRLTLKLYPADVNKYIDASVYLEWPSSENVITAKVRVYQAYEVNTSTIRKISIEYCLINYTVGLSPIKETQTVRLINPSVNVSFLPENRDVYIGGLPEYINANEVYSNGIYDSSGEIMREWNRKGLTEQLDYPKIYADNILNANIKRTDKVTCRIADRRGGELSYFNLITQLNGKDDDKKYIVNSWERDEGAQITSLELIELVKGFSVFESELPLRLLEDGESRLLEDGSYRLLESE